MKNRILSVAIVSILATLTALNIHMTKSENSVSYLKLSNLMQKAQANSEACTQDDCGNFHNADEVYDWDSYEDQNGCVITWSLVDCVPGHGTCTYSYDEYVDC